MDPNAASRPTQAITPVKKMKHQLGNPTNKAWLSGWDAGICGLSSNPYVRRPQAEAWKRGREAGLRSNDADVAQMKRRAGYH